MEISAKAGSSWHKAIVVLGLGVFVTLAYVFVATIYADDYAEFLAAGRDLTGRYRVYGTGRVVILTRDDREYYLTTPGNYATLVNNPRQHSAQRLLFNRGEFE